MSKQWNNHRKKQLKEAAAKILYEDEIKKDKERQILFPEIKERPKETPKERQRSRDPIKQ